MTHDEVSELLGAFALDAVDGDEYELIEAHLAECPRCRAEVDAHREVAAALGNSVEPLPDGLWDSIASRLPPRHDEEVPPMPLLVREAPAEAGRGRREAAKFRRSSRGHQSRITSVIRLTGFVASRAAPCGVDSPWWPPSRSLPQRWPLSSA